MFPVPGTGINIMRQQIKSMSMAEAQVRPAASCADFSGSNFSSNFKRIDYMY